MSWHFIQGKCLLFAAEHILILPLSNKQVQGHYTQTNTSFHTRTHTHTHPQASANSIFSPTYTHTASHAVHPHKHIKSERLVLTAERRQLLDCVSFWQAGGVASTALPVNTTWPWTIHIYKTSTQLNQLLSRASLTMRKYRWSIILACKWPCDLRFETL